MDFETESIQEYNGEQVEIIEIYKHPLDEVTDKIYLICPKGHTSLFYIKFVRIMKLSFKNRIIDLIRKKIMEILYSGWF